VTCATGIRLTTFNGQELLGLTGQMKVNTCLRIVRRRHRNPVIHMGPVKPCMAVITGTFQSIYSGTHFPASGFHYIHPTQVWEFTNLTNVSGLLPHPDNTAEIPIIPVAHIQGDTVFSSLLQDITYE